MRLALELPLPAAVLLAEHVRIECAKGLEETVTKENER